MIAVGFFQLLKTRCKECKCCLVSSASLGERDSTHFCQGIPGFPVGNVVKERSLIQTGKLQSLVPFDSCLVGNNGKSFGVDIIIASGVTVPQQNNSLEAASRRCTRMICFQ